jgi:integrase
VFRALAAEWQAHVLPTYKHSTQKNHRHILEEHLLPRFGDKAMTEITRQEVQAYVAHLVNNGYAARTTDHIHYVLSAILRTAVKWGHLQENPARNVNLPTLANVRPKWALTIAQASALVEALPALPKTMVGVALLSGLRRGELFALRWRDLDEQRQCLTVREAVSTKANLVRPRQRLAYGSFLFQRPQSSWLWSGGVASSAVRATTSCSRRGRENRSSRITSCGGGSSQRARR